MDLKGIPLINFFPINSEAKLRTSNINATKSLGLKGKV